MHLLDKLLTMLDITSEELVACGDGMNDIPMLKYAGLGSGYGECISWKLRNMQMSMHHLTMTVVWHML